MRSLRSLCQASMVGDHVFVPFAMEDGGTLGAHALALLMMLGQKYAVAQGCLPSHLVPRLPGDACR